MIQFLMAALVATHPTPACSWNSPGANPYRGDVAAALADYQMDSKTRATLQERMRAHRFDAMVTITKDKIGGYGLEAEYENLRDMHGGHGRLCHGPVDRSKWKPSQTERGLVYCADGVCVIVPTICNNVALVDRKAKPEVQSGNEPIDIEPAAGPTPVPIKLDVPDIQVATVEPEPMLLPTEPTFEEPVPRSAFVTFGDTGVGGPIGVGSAPGQPGGPGPGCGCLPPPVLPPVCPPPVIPPISTVPESKTAFMLLAGLGMVLFRKSRRNT